MNKLFLNASALAIACAAVPAVAAAQAADTEVIVTGTRTTGLKAADSPAPIEVVGSDALKRTGYPDLPDALASSVPSLNVQQNGADAGALTVQAALRGVSPNDTLVLVNGKRRHPTADLNVDGGSSYSGAASVDLSFIPIGAIDHVEVLTDGAAAQYGTDAIAGVVNIILKNAAHGGSISGTAGQYYSGDGNTGAWSVNRGVSLGEKGYFNATIEERYHDFSTLGVGDKRVTDRNGALLTTVNPVIVAGAPHAQNFPNVNRLNGDPSFNLYNLMFNAGYDLGSGVEAYAFGSYGKRVASHYENYRLPNKIVGTTSTGQTVYPIPYGFDPLEKFDETDYSGTLGVRGELFGWKWDVSTTYGTDTDEVYTINSANLNLFQALQGLQATPLTTPQRNFHDGAYKGTQWVNTLDVDRSVPVPFFAGPLNIAAGIESRRETYEIDSGDPSSYYGGGAQSFTGYSPLDQGLHSRTNVGIYGDLAADVIAGLHADLAGRWEHYSDFGDATVGKLTARYDFSPMIAIRGTVSTGFRAPTLAEEYYSGTNVSPSSADVQLPPNSTAAALAGFGSLKPEISHNYSVGFVAHPLPRLQITADFYEIDIHDRILVSGFLFGSESGYGTNGVVSQGVLNAIANRGVTLDSGLSYTGISIFSNAANTRTQGMEFTATYASDFGEWGHVDWSLAANLNSNTIEKLAPLPAAVTNAGFGQTTFFSPLALSALKTGTPREKVILQGIWSVAKFTVQLRETVYGPASELVSFDGSGSGSGTFNERISTTGITDLDIGYKITPKLRLNVGANNLFDQKPPTTPVVASSSSASGFRATDGGQVFRVPYTFAAWGANGGYYYGRLTYSF